MTLTRRDFLKASAASAVVVALPLGSAGCAPVGEVPGVDVEADRSLVYFASGLTFTLDQRRHRVVVTNAVGAQTAVLGGFGLTDTKLNFPTDLAVGEDGLVYVADRGNHRVQVYRTDGTWVRSLGSDLSYPAAVAVDGDEVVIADSGHHRLQRVSTDGRSVTSFGDESLSCPTGLAVDDAGRVHVASAGDGTIHVYARSGSLLRKYGASDLFRPRAVLASNGVVLVGDPTMPGVFVYDSEGALVDRVSTVGNTGVAQLSLTPSGRVRAAAA